MNVYCVYTQVIVHAHLQLMNLQYNHADDYMLTCMPACGVRYPFTVVMLAVVGMKCPQKIKT